jgi:hypothetical protein
VTVAESPARIHFQHELQQLEAQALGALDLVISSLDRVMEALHHQDIELASIVILDDDRVDGRYLEVHQGVLSLLALQAPVASDLRTVAALLHVIKHAERMGDQCVNIAKVIPLLQQVLMGLGALSQAVPGGPEVNPPAGGPIPMQPPQGALPPPGMMQGGPPPGMPMGGAPPEMAPETPPAAPPMAPPMQ